MDLTGGRTVLFMNIGALAVALIAYIEGAYTVYALLGIVRPLDFVGIFFPALVMFVLRNQRFSSVFLFMYVALALQMFTQAASVFQGTFRTAGLKEYLGYAALFFLISLACLGTYIGASLLRILVRKASSLFFSRS